MQAFLASDVVYSQRVAPLIAKALDDNGIGGQRIAQSRFLGDRELARPRHVVTQRLSGAGGTAAATGKPAPGLHGHGLDSVSVGGDRRSQPTRANRIPSSAAPDVHRQVHQPGRERRDEHQGQGLGHRRRRKPINADEDGRHDRRARRRRPTSR